MKSRSDVIESEGYDAEEVDRRIAADHAREEDLGLKFGRPASVRAEPAVEVEPRTGELREILVSLRVVQIVRNRTVTPTTDVSVNGMALTRCGMPCGFAGPVGSRT